MIYTNLLFLIAFFLGGIIGFSIAILIKAKKRKDDEFIEIRIDRYGYTDDEKVRDFTNNQGRGKYKLTLTRLSN